MTRMIQKIKTRKSNVDYLFMIDGTPISESSKKKSIVTLSYCEIKYVVASKLVNHNGLICYLKN
jgi:hypothetical protein